ncbi:MAG: hypothetical protein LBM75_00680 [Myxococcales bacterium]|jgi:hypothetical protein|nr:hypothetical protein [Myxococcales bacterium]
MKKIALFGLTLCLAAFGCGGDADENDKSTDDALAELCASHSLLGFSSQEACRDALTNAPDCVESAQTLRACDSKKNKSTKTTRECTLDDINHEGCWDDYLQCQNEYFACGETLACDDAFDLCADAVLDEIEACQNELLEECRNDEQGNPSTPDPVDSCESENEILRNCIAASELH